MALIENLIQEGWLKTERIIEAFQKIKRADFLPKEIKDLAEINEALPIGKDQTISQPLVVAFMLELLCGGPDADGRGPDSCVGKKILDVGFGSGWTSSLLAEIVGIKGKVIAIEIVPDIAQFGKSNISKYNFIEKGIVQCFLSDGSRGYGKEAPFDKILASASADYLPSSWKEQLKTGGRIVAPIGNSIWVFDKIEENKFKEREYPGFVFVPLIKK